MEKYIKYVKEKIEAKGIHMPEKKKIKKIAVIALVLFIGFSVYDNNRGTKHLSREDKNFIYKDPYMYGRVEFDTFDYYYDNRKDYVKEDRSIIEHQRSYVQAAYKELKRMYPTLYKN